MRKTYYDDCYCEKTIEVDENAKLVMKRFLFHRYKMGSEIKEALISQTTLLEAFQCDIDEETIKNFFSDKVGNALRKIKKHNAFEELTASEALIFVCDFIMPIAYSRVELIQNTFRYQWILNEGKFFWKILRQELKSEIYSIAYNEDYNEPEYSDEEILMHEISKNKKLQKIISPCITIEANFEALLNYRDEISNELYGYCVRMLYVLQTRGVATKLFHEVFDGLSKTDLMNESDFKVYNSLPDIITIFRGTDADEQEPRPSWSLSIDVARKFNHGKTMKANITKDRVIAYFDTSEKEILVWLNQDEVEII